MDGIDGEMIEIVLFEVMSMHLNEQCCCWNGSTNEKRSYMASHVIKHYCSRTTRRQCQLKHGIG